MSILHFKKYLYKGINSYSSYPQTLFITDNTRIWNILLYWFWRQAPRKSMQIVSCPGILVFPKPAGLYLKYSYFFVMQIALSPGYVRFALCSFWVIGVLRCGHLRVCSFLSSPVCSFWFVAILVSGRFQMSSFFPASVYYQHFYNDLQ